MAVFVCAVLTYRRFRRLLSHNVTHSVLEVVQRASYMNYAFEILGNNEFLGETYNLSPRLPNHNIVPPVRATLRSNSFGWLRVPHSHLLFLRSPQFLASGQVRSRAALFSRFFLTPCL